MSLNITADVNAVGYSITASNFYGDGSGLTNISGSGVQGTQGIQGAQGIQGITGPQGIQGIQGTQGIQGDTGVQGITGIQGIQGIRGAQGIQGIQGTTGIQGFTGIQGTQGIQGIQGITGAQGIQGIQGPQGITGIQGTQGIQGITGSQGIQGIQGIQGVTGSQGIQGIQGVTGSQGIQGIQGITGIQGTQGIQGIQGITGIQGIQGAQGITGIQGTQGIQGIQGITGIQGIQGAQGITGIQGTQGIQGLQGLTGLAFTIAKVYASVAALQADTSPTGIVSGQFAIINTGNVQDADNSKLYLWNGSSYVFINDLSGSAGIQGVTGSQGIQGIQGITGAQGVTGIQGTTGAQGATGAQGIQGIQGITGAQGLTGVQGITGSQGIQGIQGTTGIQGIQGITGATGATGSTGAQGIQGIQGITGATGIQGATGSTGVQGIQGTQGITGSTGIQGIQGITGATGAQGIQGTQGITGATGAQGIQGTQGITGATGAQGIQGIQGLTGPSTAINATNDTSTTALYPVFVAAAGSNQTPKVTTGGLIWNASTNLLNISGSANIDVGINFLRGSGEYSTYIKANDYVDGGYNGSTLRYWIELGAKGGTHIVLNTDGAAADAENAYDHFTIWQAVNGSGAIAAGARKFWITNTGRVNFVAGIWHKSSEGIERIHFGSTGSTFYKGGGTGNIHTFRNASDQDILTLTNAKDATLVGNLTVSGGTVTATTFTGNAATVTNGVYTNGSYADPAWITSLAKSKVGLANVENTALSTWAGSTSITTLGTISSGTWSATTITLDRGGTGSTTASGARTNLDVYSKGEVDSIAQGLDVKASVRAATTANITLSAPQSIDGVAVVAGDRVLVKNQSTPAQNGIYVVAAAAWTRATDFNAWTEIPSSFFFVEEGTTNADSGWVCTSNAGGTLDSTAITFSQFSGAGQITAGTGLSKTGNTIDIANTTVSATSYGSASSVATFTVNAQGQLTAATNVAIAISVGAVSGLANSATITAASTNTANQIVLRDASGNFSAGTITATLSGNATTATTAGNVSGTVAIANGGTGQTTATAANTAIGNWGQLEAHGTYQDLNTVPATWGFSFVQGSTNAPHGNSGQWYRGRFSLGSGYGIGTAGGSYWLEMAMPRSAGNSYGNMYFRVNESGTVSSWYPVSGITTNSLTAGSYLTGGTFNGSSAVTIAVDATSSNTASKIVARDAGGGFSAGAITATSFGDGYNTYTLAQINRGGGAVELQYNTTASGSNVNIFGNTANRWAWQADTGKLVLGSAGDTNLYRGGADILKTDDAFEANSLTAVSSATTQISINSTGSGSKELVFKNNGTVAGYVWHTGGYVAVGGGNASTSLAVLTSNGNVGIGTTGPSVKLEVYGADQRMKISTSAADAGSLTIGQWDGVTNRIESSNRKLLLTSYSTGISLGMSGTEHVQISATGALTSTISTTSPIYYDSANSSFYCDPAGTSALAGATLSSDPASDRSAITRVWSTSRGENLVTNGSGLMGSNYNFSGFTFDAAQTHGGGGSFRKNVASGSGGSDELMPVDIEKTYRLVAWARSGEDGGTNYNPSNYQYLGITPLDIDGNLVDPFSYSKYPGSTDTTLAVALNTGATTMTLTSAAGWLNTAGAGAYQRQMVWYGYTNSKGYTYPNYTYTRNNSYYTSSTYQANGMWAAGGISGNVVTLTAPWPGPNIPAGTAVRNTNSGGTYKYITITGAVPNTWTRYEGYIGGIDTGGEQLTNKFPYGTAFVKLLFLFNYHGLADNNIRYSDIWFSETSSRNLEGATTNFSGVVTTGAQSFAGDKVFTGNVTSPGFYNSTDSTNRFVQGSLVLRNSAPTVYFRDTDNNSAMIHVNSNILYVLRGSNDTETYTQVNGVWPLEINLTNNNATFGGTVTATSFIGNATTATTLQTARNIAGVSFNGSADISITGQNITTSVATAANDLEVAKYLRWKNYGNGHVLIDASQGTAPTGAAIDRYTAGQTITNAGAGSNTWGEAISLMGWNGTTTYGVRVDRARTIDNQANSATTTAATANTGNTIVLRDASGNFSAGTVTATQFNGSGAGLSSGTVPIASLVAGDYSSKITSGTYSINVTSADQIDGVAFRNTGSNAGTAADSLEQNGITYVNSNISLLGQTDGALFSQAYNSNWQHQIYGDYRTGQIVVRGKNNGTWQSWRTVLDSSNYTSYTGHIGNGTLTLNTSGSGISGSASFTANQSGNVTFTVTSNATASNTASTIMLRGSSNEVYVGDVYSSQWFRNYGTAGLYNQDHGNHWYATGNDYWNLAGNNASNIGIILRSGGHQGTIRGYVYADSSNNIGFLNNGGSWRLRAVGGDYILAEGSSIRGQLFYDSNDTNYYCDPASTSVLNRLNVAGYSMRSSATLDLSNTGTYATTNYYPVTIPLATGMPTRMRIVNALNSNVPSWATHAAGFTCHVEWTSNGSGWGTIAVQRSIHRYTEGYTNSTICGGITQMTNGSIEVIWLRGGGRYYFEADADVTPTIQSTTYTNNGQSVTPGSAPQNDVLSAATDTRPSFQRLNLTQSTGTAPMTVSSTTLVTNLNADLLDGYNSAETGSSIILRTQSNGYLNIDNWIQVGSAGLYSSVNSAHWTPNQVGSYSPWRTINSRGGYGGIYDDYSGVNWMHDSAGNGGIYRQGNSRWILYHNIANNCTGINGSATASGYGLYVNGNSYLSGYERVGGGNLYIDGNYGRGVVGLYSATRYQGVFAMGDSYKLADDGTTTGSLYGIAWSHPNAGGVAANLNTHGALVMENGTFLAAISGSIRCRDDMRAPRFYDSNDTNYYCDPAGTSVLAGINLSGLVNNGISLSGTNPTIYSSNGLIVSTTSNLVNVAASNVYLRPNNGSVGTYWTYIDSGLGLSVTTGDARAPAFYDYNDTAYFVDPTATESGKMKYSFTINGVGSAAGYGLALYPSYVNTGGSNTSPTYGIMFASTTTYGTHGAVNVSGDWATYFTMNGTAGRGWVFRNTDSGNVASIGNNGRMRIASLGVNTDPSATNGEIRATDNITAYYSDERLKTKLGIIENPIEKVKSLSGFYFEANETAVALGYQKKREVGVSAQEVQAILPEIIAPAPIDDKYMTVRYEKLIPLLIEAIKEQQKQIEELKSLLSNNK